MIFRLTIKALVIFSILFQNLGAEILRVPFHLKRNVVIIPTRINGSGPLDLILDTGMTFDGVYLFNGKLLKEIDNSKLIQVRVPGAGSGEPSNALMVENGEIKFGDVTVDSQRVIISTSQHTQSFQSDGVIGWNLFGHYVVNIDYDVEMITLYDQDLRGSDLSWQKIPIILKNNMPFLDVQVEVVDGETTKAVFYIDLASNAALELLIKPDQKYKLPDSLKSTYLGTGLSGDIYGLRGHSRHLWLADYALTNIPTAFAPAEVRSKQEGADGILGNDSIRRFNLIFDYPHQTLYIKPNKYFAADFE